MENTESKINKTDITVSDESENKSMSVNNENMSTESADRSDSGAQTGLIITNENNLSDSITISNAGAKSTPKPQK